VYWGDPRGRPASAARPGILTLPPRCHPTLIKFPKIIAHNARYFSKIPRIHQPLQFPKIIAHNARYFPKIPRTAAKHSQEELVQLQKLMPWYTLSRKII
jgi:hypothetical protein